MRRLLAGVLVAMTLTGAPSVDASVTSDELNRLRLESGLKAALRPEGGDRRSGIAEVGRLSDAMTTSSGKPVAKSSLLGAVAVRDQAVADLTGFQKRLRELHRTQLGATSRDLLAQSGPVFQAFKRMFEARERATDEHRTAYEANLKQADALDAAGPGARDVYGLAASDYRDRAANSPFGVYRAAQQQFFGLLDKSPLLGLQMNGTYLFKALQTTQFNLLADTALPALVGGFLLEGADQAGQGIADANSVASVDDMLKYGGPRYARQQEAAALAGGPFVAGLISDLQGTYAAQTSAREADEFIQDNLLNLGLGLISAGSILIPVAGPAIALGVTTIQVYRDGNELVIAYLDEKAGDRLAPVTSFVHKVTDEERTKAAAGALVISVVGAIADVGAVAGEIKSIRTVGVGAADGLPGAAGPIRPGVGARAGVPAAAADGAPRMTPAIARRLEKAQSIAGKYGLNQATEQARAILTKASTTAENALGAHGVLNRLDKIDDLIRSGRIPQAQVEAALAKARAAGAKGSSLETLERELTVAKLRADEITVVLPTDADDLGNYTLLVTGEKLEGDFNLDKFRNGPQPLPTAKVDLSIADEVTRKIADAAQGKAVQFLPAETAFIQNEIVRRGEAAQKLFRFDDDLVDLVPVFDDTFFDNVRIVRGRQFAANLPPEALSVLIDWRTGRFLTPDQIARLSPEQLAKLPSDTSFLQMLPSDVNVALGERVRSGNARAKPNAAPPAPVGVVPVAAALPSPPNVLVNPRTGAYLSPAEIAKLTPDQLRTLPDALNALPSDVTVALNARVHQVAREERAAAAARAPAPGPPPPVQAARPLDVSKGNAVNPGRPAVTPFRKLDELKPELVSALTDDELGSITAQQVNALPDGPLKTALGQEARKRVRAAIGQLRAQAAATRRALAGGAAAGAAGGAAGPAGAVGGTEQVADTPTPAPTPPTPPEAIVPEPRPTPPTPADAIAPEPRPTPPAATGAAARPGGGNNAAPARGDFSKIRRTSKRNDYTTDDEFGSLQGAIEEALEEAGFDVRYGRNPNSRAVKNPDGSVTIEALDGSFRVTGRVRPDGRVAFEKEQKTAVAPTAPPAAAAADGTVPATAAEDKPAPYKTYKEKQVDAIKEELRRQVKKFGGNPETVQPVDNGDGTFSVPLPDGRKLTGKYTFVGNDGDQREGVIYYFEGRKTAQETTPAGAPGPPSALAPSGGAPAPIVTRIGSGIPQGDRDAAQRIVDNYLVENGGSAEGFTPSRGKDEFTIRYSGPAGRTVDAEFLGGGLKLTDSGPPPRVPWSGFEAERVPTPGADSALTGLSEGGPFDWNSPFVRNAMMEYFQNPPNVPLTSLPGLNTGTVQPAYQNIVIQVTITEVPPRPLPSISRGLLDRVRDVLLGSFRAPELPRAARSFTLLPMTTRAWQGETSSTATPATAPLTIAHDAPACVVAEQHSRIEACPKPASNAARAQVWFRSRDDEAWRTVNMQREGACFSAALPKPMSTIAEFQYFIGMTTSDGGLTLAPETTPRQVFRPRVVKRESDCGRGLRVARGAAKAAQIVIHSLKSGSGVPSGFGSEGVVSPASAVGVSLVATGASTGAVFQLQAVNSTGEAVRVTADDALVVQPVQPGSLKPVAAAARDGARVHTDSVIGYCADFAKPPPPPGTVYRVADASIQQRLRPLSNVIKAGRQLAEAGRLHPDSEPKAYADSIKQWAIWTRMEGWDEQAFSREFVDRTQKNVVDLKKPWTKALEQAVRAAVPNRWRDITMVLEEARKGGEEKSSYALGCG